jgi:hypothetical protein
MRKLLVKKSQISGAGLGLFADEDIKKGTIVLIFSLDAFTISKNEYDSQQSDNNDLMMTTGCRFIGDIFLYTDSRVRFENYINHAFEPNLLYHAGLCIATSDIKRGAELTLDYGLILSENDKYSFIDTKTNKYVCGLSGTDALKASTRKLMDLINDVVEFTT